MLPFVVVNAALSIDVGDLLPDAALTRADGTDTLQQLPEVILAKKTPFPALAAHHPLQNPSGCIPSGLVLPTDGT